MLLASVLGLLAATPLPLHADPQEPTEKCDNLQDRCLHNEKGVCVVWHDECVVKKPVGHGAKRHKLRLGAHHNKV